MPRMQFRASESIEQFIERTEPQVQYKNDPRPHMSLSVHTREYRECPNASDTLAEGIARFLES